MRDFRAREIVLGLSLVFSWEIVANKKPIVFDYTYTEGYWSAPNTASKIRTIKRQVTFEDIPETYSYATTGSSTDAREYAVNGIFLDYVYKNNHTGKKSYLTNTRVGIRGESDLYASVFDATVSTVCSSDEKVVASHGDFAGKKPDRIYCGDGQTYERADKAKKCGDLQCVAQGDGTLNCNGKVYQLANAVNNDERSWIGKTWNSVFGDDEKSRAIEQ